MTKSPIARQDIVEAIDQEYGPLLRLFRYKLCKLLMHDKIGVEKIKLLETNPGVPDDCLMNPLIRRIPVEKKDIVPG